MILIPDIPSIVLNLPIIISFIAVTRYIIGLKTWKNYPAVALALAYYLFFSLLESHLIAIVLLTAFTVLIFASSTITRYLIRKTKVNYYARMAIIYLSATIFALIGIAIVNVSALGSIVSDPLFGIAVFIIGTTIDDLTNLQFKKGMQEFVRRFITTMLLSLVSGFMLSSVWWNNTLGRHQEILLLVLIVDVITAFWSALRLTEFVRFSSIIRNKK